MRRLIVPALSSAWAQTNAPPMHNSAWWWEPLQMLIGLLFLGLIVVLMIILTHKLRSEENRRAIDPLDERYAKGEIDREEYLQRRRDILGR